MNINDVKQFIEENKDNEEVKNYIGGFITSGRVEEFLNSDDGKKLLQPKLDSYHSKSLESWKMNNIEKLLDAEVKKRFPAKDEREIEVEKLRLEVEKMKQEKLHETLKNKALTYATEKKLPVNLVDYFLGADEEGTIKNLNSLEEVFNAHIQNQVEERLKSNNYTPPKSNSQSTDISKMSMEEYANYWQEQNKK